MNDLDTLARRAADDLRAGVADVAVPERPARSPLPGLAAAAVAVLALLVGSLAVLRTDDPTPVITDGPLVPRLVVRHLPGDLELTGGADLPLGPDELASPIDVSFYGDDDRDPTLTLSRRVGVTATTAPTPEPPYHEEAGTRVLRVEQAGAVHYLASRTLDRAGLEAAATQLALGPDGPTAVPEGLPLIGRLRDAMYGPVPLVVPQGARGHVVGYQSESADQQIAVAAVEGGRDLVVLAGLVNGPEQVVDSQVRGHTGRLFEYRQGIRTLVWQESPGIVVAMTTTLPRVDLLAAAESLEPASDEEWADILALDGDDDGASSGEVSTATTSTTSVTLVPGEVLSSGRLLDGRQWKVLRQDDGDVCAEVVDLDGRGSASGCLPPDEQAASWVEAQRDRLAEPALLWGRCPEGATAVQAQDDHGLTSVPCRPWFALDTVDHRYEEVVFRSADGQELGRLPVDS